MARSRRWGGPRIVPYNPNARDADHDGMVQEGTNWERPGGTRFVNQLGQEIAAAARAATPGAYIADENGNRVDYTPTWQQGGTPGGDVPDVGGLPRLGDVGMPSIGDTHGTISEMVGTVEGPPQAPDLTPDKRDVPDVVPEPPKVIGAGEMGEPTPFRSSDSRIGRALDVTEGSGELKALFDEELIPQAEDAFETFTDAEAADAAKEVYTATQRSLLERGLPEKFVVWRQTSGTESDTSVESFSLRQKTSTFTEQEPFLVDRSSVLVDVNAFYPQAFVGENEVLVRFSDVEPVTLEKATDVPEAFSAMTGEPWKPETGLTPARIGGAGLYTLPDMVDYQKSDNNMDPWYDEWRLARMREEHRRQREGIKRYWDHAGRIDSESDTGAALNVWRQDFSNSSSMRRIISGEAPSPAYDNESTRNQARLIAEALGRAPELGDPQWRVQTFGGDLKPGDDLDFPAVSAAVSRPEAEGFLGSTDVISDAIDGAKPVLLRFPSDTHGVYHDDDGYLPRESIVTGKFRVASVEPTQIGNREVDMVTLERVGSSDLSRSAGEVAEDIEDAIRSDEPDFADYGIFRDNADYLKQFADAKDDFDRQQVLMGAKRQQEAEYSRALDEAREARKREEAARTTVDLPEQPRETPPLPSMNSTTKDLDVKSGKVKNGAKLHKNSDRPEKLDLSEAGIRKRVDSLAAQIGEDFGIDVDEVVWSLDWEEWHNGPGAGHPGAVAFYEDGKVYLSPSAVRDLGSDDPQTYLEGIRVVSHEMGHGASGSVKNGLVNSGLRPVAEEAGAEISSISNTIRRADDELVGAARAGLPGADGYVYFEGREALYLQASYPERVEEIILQAVRRNGWDPEAVYNDIMYTFSEGDPQSLLYEDGTPGPVRIFPQNVGGRGATDDPVAEARWRSIWGQAPSDIMAPYDAIIPENGYRADEPVIDEAHLTEGEWVERQKRVAALLYWMMERG